MWYRVAKKQLQQEKKTESKPAPSDSYEWVDFVPEHLWQLRGTAFDLLKTCALQKSNIPVDYWEIRKSGETIGGNSNLEKAKTSAEAAFRKQ